MDERAGDDDPRMTAHESDSAAHEIDLALATGDTVAELGHGERDVADDGMDRVEVRLKLLQTNGRRSALAIVDVHGDDVHTTVFAGREEGREELRA